MTNLKHLGLHKVFEFSDSEFGLDNSSLFLNVFFTIVYKLNFNVLSILFPENCGHLLIFILAQAKKAT